jgi:hypothetical protein
MSDPSESSEDSPPPGDGESTENGDQPPPRKRHRVRLSCLECRRRKLSCDREFPCSRCLQSGTPDRCEFESRPGIAPPTKLGIPQSVLSGLDGRLSLPIPGVDPNLYRRDSAREYDRIRRLELEVSQLKGLLAKQGSLDGSTAVDRSPNSAQRTEVALPEPEATLPSFLQPQDSNVHPDELRFFRGKEFKTRFFGPHSACLAFSEV